MEKININTKVLTIFFVAFVILMMIAGLAAIPATQEAQAANQNSDSKNKGQQGEISSDCKRQGKDKKVVSECTEPPPPPPEEDEGVFCFNGRVEGDPHAQVVVVCLQTEEECEEFTFDELVAKGPCREFDELPRGACVPATDGDGIVCEDS